MGTRLFSTVQAYTLDRHGWFTLTMQKVQGYVVAHLLKLCVVAFVRIREWGVLGVTVGEREEEKC